VTSNDSWRRYLEAGTAMGQVTLARAEEIAKGLLAPGDDEREAAWDDFKDLTQFGRLMGEQLVELVRAELSKQLESLGVGPLEELFDRLADLVRSAPVDVPSERPGSSPAGSPPLHLEPVIGIGDTGDTQPIQREKAGKKPKAKNMAPKAKADTINAGMKDAKGAKKAKAEKHPKGEKHKKKAKKTDAQATDQAAGPNRVLTLTRTPDSAGRV
jgi:hypothetical protein